MVGAPTASAALATPRIEPTVAPVAGRPGLLTRRGEQIIVRPESDTSPIHIIPSLGLSADGSRVAYWTESGGAAALHVMELGGTDRVVVTFPDRIGAGIAWSTDGSGLLVSIAGRPPPGASPIQHSVIARVLHAVDIASGSSREVYQGIGPSGASVMPLVWRREPEIFAAYETGPGGYAFGYTVIRPGQPPVRSDPGADTVAMRASSDGAFVFAQWLFEPGATVKAWPLEDFSQQVELRAKSGEQLGQPRWWPDQRVITVEVGRSEGGAWRDLRIERWDPASGARVVLQRLPDGGSLGSYFTRADGSGFITFGPGRAWYASDLISGSTTEVPLAEGEVILGTVLIR